MIKISGTISKITFRNEDTGFCVLQLKSSNSSQVFSCIGIIPGISKGENVSLCGNWELNKRFGKQFTVTSYELLLPDTHDGIFRLLSSGLISNIGPVKSKAIVDKFGLLTLNVLDTEPERLIEVNGIGKKTIEKITLEWKKQNHLRSLVIFLQEYDISLNLIYKINKVYGIDAKRKISDNPYVLIDDLRGIGFLKADKIAKKMGYEQESFKRIRAGIIYTVQEAINEGHSCLPKEQLIQKATELLCVNKDTVILSLDSVIESKSLLNEKNHVYIPVYFYAERFIAKNILDRIVSSNSSKQLSFTIKEIGEWLDNYQFKTGWFGDDLQKKAINTALHNPLILLTGGPGTGKTTILKVIVAFFLEKGWDITLAAPTGRAAERMSCVTGLSAKTLHRILEYKSNQYGLTFQKNENNLLQTDIVIVDEFSMVDLLLMRHLLAALPIGCSIIFIGDYNQLPSVGAGNVLSDLISSDVIPHVHLSKIFRQASSSRIVTVAHEIIQGKIPIFYNLETDDCFFISKENPNECTDCIIDLAIRRLPEKYKLDPINDIQVISPMHRGVLGTQYLNNLLQNSLNMSKSKLVRGAYQFQIGDKVMQIKNNYDTGIFNGDIGIIADIVHDTSLIIKFNGNFIEYSSTMLDEIQLAYCISIHKSQGSEYQAVIIPVSTQHYIMLQRNLFYTAITRAKKICVIVGTRNALTIAVKNNKAFNRYSLLPDLLKMI